MAEEFVGEIMNIGLTEAEVRDLDKMHASSGYRVFFRILTALKDDYVVGVFDTDEEKTQQQFLTARIAYQFAKDVGGMPEETKNILALVDEAKKSEKKT